MRTRPGLSLTGAAAPGRTVDGMRRLGWLSLFGGTCVVAGGVYLVTGAGIPCPFLALTGWLCPLCGASRMGAALVLGDAGAAWGWNPFVLSVGPLLTLVWLWTAARLVLRRPAGLPGPLVVIDGWSPTRVVMFLLVPALVFTVLRNLL